MPNRYIPKSPKITIHKARNVSRSSILHPYARSATERNFNANASSRNPNVTLITFIHPPDLGIDLSHDGNRAKSVKGNASAIANPSIPMAGATTLPVVETSTSRKPIIGPVQENDTSDNVNAIRNILNSPVVCSALLSTALLHFEGRVISNAPKNDAANTRSIRQNRMLKTAFVDNALRALAPKISVMASPRVR